MKAPSILILEDDPHASHALRLALESDHEVSCFTEGHAAEDWMDGKAAGTPALVILDLHLKNQSGLDWLKRWRTRFPLSKYIFCSGERDIERAMPCLREGAYDFVTKPFSKQQLLESVSAALSSARTTIASTSSETPFIGRSPEIQSIRERLEVLREAPEINVLIRGETGTGKEIAAQYLNQETGRSMTAVSAGAIHASLAEGELFGVEKGAYTGAIASRPGLLEMADGGDLFFDEIGELASEIQVKMLRALQEKVIMRVGGTRLRPARFRLISATNRLAYGYMREDFLFRIAEEVITLPPLRERCEDIVLLAYYHLRRFSGGRTVSLSDAAKDQLVSYDWPGNIRQLVSVMKRALHRLPDGKRVIDTLPPLDPFSEDRHKGDAFEVSSFPSYRSEIAAAERRLILEALKQSKGDVSRAARRLGLPRTTFYRQMKRAGISPGPLA